MQVEVNQPLMFI